MAQAGTLKNLLTAWSRLLLSSLADAGVTDVVLSPGSRSTPFMIAAVAEPRLRCHDSIDERAAAFFALGQARVTGRPSVVICTSGTAAAHYLPAVVEANLAGVPLIVLTSDRPLELQDSAAAQTIDQIKLFGDHVRRFYELGTPDPAPSALTGLRRLAAQAVFWATEGGPVHLNARARKPLEPVAASSEEEFALDATVEGLLARPIVSAFAPSSEPDPAAVARVASLCRSCERGLIVAGPAPVGGWPDPWIVDDLAWKLGYPLLTESTSQLRLVAVGGHSLRVDSFDLLLRSPGLRSSLRPDLVIQLGGAPTSSGFEQLCASLAPTGAHVAVHPRRWVDPGSSATHVVLSDPAVFVDELSSALGDLGRGSTPWWTSWREADDRAWSIVQDCVSSSGPSLTEAGLIQTLVPALPAGSLLMVGNSLPIRNIDAYARSGTATVEVLSQRGANGIDGLVAGAAGAASAEGQTVTLLLGDVSIVHDLTGLVVAAAPTDAPLVIVVANNGGGRIFETLPIARSGLGPQYLDHVTTPHSLRIEHAARLAGHRYAVVTDAASFELALSEAYSSRGGTVIEVTLPPDGGAPLQTAIQGRVDTAFAARLGEN